jgi:hypothetical protein
LFRSKEAIKKYKNTVGLGIWINYPEYGIEKNYS